VAATLEATGLGSLIAVVDDDEAFRASMRRLLRSMGYLTATFSDAAQFLASSVVGDAACLIADIQMPSMSGIELHRHLVESGREIPTILVTAYADERDEGEMLKAGVNCYLRKPLNETELIECLRSALVRSS